MKSRTAHRNVRDVDDAIKAIRQCANRIETDAHRALTRDMGPSVGPDGFPKGGGDGGSRSSDSTSSTEQAALAQRQTDIVRISIRTAVTALARVIQDMVLAADNFDYAANVGEDKRGRESQAPICVNPHCDALALWPNRPTPKKGRCQACYQHQYRYGVDRLTDACVNGCNHVTNERIVA